MNDAAVSFKKLVAVTRKEFRNKEIDLDLKTKKDPSLEHSHFYVEAFYDQEHDFNNETPIEVYVYHNFTPNDQFLHNQITEFLIQIYDAVVHELRHQLQSRARFYETFSEGVASPFAKYLADPDELDAYAVSIAIELLRSMPKGRAIRYMSRMTVLSKIKSQHGYISPNLKCYVAYYGSNPLIKKVAKKVYKHLNSLDSNQIFR
jgi:hypothetical protein